MNDRHTNELRDVRVREKKLEYQRPQATFLVFSTDSATLADPSVNSVVLTDAGGDFGSAPNVFSFDEDE